MTAIHRLGFIAVLGLLAWPASAADVPTLDQSAKDFTAVAQPLLKKYCLDCHSTEKTEGELDLERFDGLNDVRKATAVWLKVAEMLDNREMPPKKATPMPDSDRRTLREWLGQYLRAESFASAGDPGPVVIRRLGNAQYTYTLRDLTGVPLDPAREFPVDGAAGEGFTNTGNALVMSPALLTKYFDAAKQVAAHAVPLPDGMRFSPATTRSDWTNEVLDQIRGLYADYTDSGGGTQVNLQGIVFGTNTGGRLPLQSYLAATLADRSALENGSKSIEEVAKAHKLSPKYLGLLWKTLKANDPSPLLDHLRSRWKAAKPADAAAITEEIGQWQAALWKFNSVGHIGKVGGPKSWMEPVSPLLTRQEFRLPIPASANGKDVTLYLVADDAGDGGDGDAVVWERPRLVAPGRPELLIRDLRERAKVFAARRDQVFAGTAKSLAAAAEAADLKGGLDIAELAKKHDVAPDVVEAWFDYLGLGSGPVAIKSHLQGQAVKVAGYEFVNGWGPGETPNMAANSSDTAVRIPGNLKPHGVAMHPSPTLRVAAGWRSPVASVLKIKGKVQPAHPECGNGVTWSLQVRRGATRQVLASGVAQGAKVVEFGPFASVPVRQGDLVSVVVGPRDANHSCDLTAVDLTLDGEDGKKWDLAADVSPDVLAGNPHADRLGNRGVWHFYTEPDKGGDGDAVIPAGSVLARWESATTPEQKQALAIEAQAILTAGPPADKDSPDAKLYRQLISIQGPLFRSTTASPANTAATEPPQKYDSAKFGKLPSGASIDGASLGVNAPSVIEIKIPAELVDGCEFVTSGVLHSASPTGSVQLAASFTKLGESPRPDPKRPVIVPETGPARERFVAAFDAMRSVFPPSLCYNKIVPVDEVVTLTLFYREDDQLKRIMLDDAQAARLDRLWDELHFVSLDAFTLVDAFLQLLEYASQDGDPKLFEPLRKPINDRADAFRKALLAAEPKQIDAVIKFAEKAYRRSLKEGEADNLRALYKQLRSEELPHDDAWRLVLARVLVSPAFLYRVETAGPGATAAPVSDWELASRLSYFLWSSTPDETLRELAASGTLKDPEVLAAQAERMLKDDKIRRLATEFACQWLHVYDFDSLDEKSDRHFPTFKPLRAAMYEETIRFFTDLFQRDLPAIAFLDADYTVVNEPLAKFYGIPGVSGDNWKRVESVKGFGRGGILGLATTLAKQSGASRTSPILRGNWVSEVLLGEKLPKPPPGVPVLPEDESSTGELSVRQLVERHSRDAKCITCHARIDPFGFSLEGYDAIGRKREKDLGNRPVEVDAKMADGTSFSGLDGLRNYLLKDRREAVCRQFSRKLLGYALGRGVQLSDDPLLDDLTRKVSDGGRFGELVAMIVKSRQFREIRGRETVLAEGP